MIFRKSERRKLPTVLGLAVGALAVVGFMSIKKCGKEILSSSMQKMKCAFNKNKSCDTEIYSCE